MDLIDWTTFPFSRLNVCPGTYVWVGLLALSVLVISSAWQRFPWKVQCWFCHAFSKVGWGSRNSWVCRHCEQYNGFDRNGDYNKTIDKMYDERKNKWFRSVRLRKHPTLNSSGEPEPPRNGLCADCNKLLEVKISMLAKFSPTNEQNAEREMENYKASLENIYRICPQCELTVSERLKNLNQKLGLTGRGASALRRRRNRLPSISSIVTQTVSRSSIRSASKLPSKRGALTRSFRTASIFVGLLISVLMWLSSLDILRTDSDNEEFLFLTRALAPFNEWLTSFNRLAPMFSLCAILLRIVFYKYSRTVMLIDHICSVGWAFLFGSYLVPQLLSLNEEQEREILVWQMLLSTGNCIIVFWTLLLPRRSALKRTQSRRSLSRGASPSSIASRPMSTTTIYTLGPRIHPDDTALTMGLSNGGAASSCRRSNARLESQLRSLSLGNRVSAQPSFGRVLSNAAQRQSTAASVAIPSPPGPSSVSSASTYRTTCDSLHSGVAHERSGSIWNNGPLSTPWPLSQFRQNRITDMVFNPFDARSTHSTVNFSNN